MNYIVGTSYRLIGKHKLAEAQACKSGQFISLAAGTTRRLISVEQRTMYSISHSYIVGSHIVMANMYVGAISNIDSALEIVLITIGLMMLSYDLALRLVVFATDNTYGSQSLGIEDWATWGYS